MRERQASPNNPPSTTLSARSSSLFISLSTDLYNNADERIPSWAAWLVGGLVDLALENIALLFRNQPDKHNITE